MSREGRDPAAAAGGGGPVPLLSLPSRLRRAPCRPQAVRPRLTRSRSIASRRFVLRRRHLRWQTRGDERDDGRRDAEIFRDRARNDLRRQTGGDVKVPAAGGRIREISFDRVPSERIGEFLGRFHVAQQAIREPRPRRREVRPAHRTGCLRDAAPDFISRGAFKASAVQMLGLLRDEIARRDLSSPAVRTKTTQPESGAK